jgi:hypothetical protein
MKVKIGNTIYDSEKVPIMIILNEKDKFNLSHMPSGAFHYCGYPGGEFTPEQIEKWMKEIPS